MTPERLQQIKALEIYHTSHTGDDPTRQYAAGGFTPFVEAIRELVAEVERLTAEVAREARVMDTIVVAAELTEALHGPTSPPLRMLRKALEDASASRVAARESIEVPGATP